MTLTSQRAPRARVTRLAALVTAAALGASILAPAVARAQSVPGAAAKRAAQHAVAATDAHTAAMTMTAPTSGTAKPAAAAAPARTPAGSAKSAKSATPEKPAEAGAAGKGRGGRASVSVTETGAAPTLTFARETFEYGGRGRRDPFVSLIKSGELRPLFTDLKLVTVLYDPTGRNSVAIMRDLSTKDQYRVKVGQTLGRMRVSQIQPKQLVFVLEEFGYSRQEVLALNDSTKARKQ